MKKKNKRVSLKDIANKVGVSTALVSYVLSGKEKEKRVSTALAKEIHQVAADMKYSPNKIAQSLRSGSTNTIGLIVTDIANPFFSAIARIIEDEANLYGYTVVFASCDEDCTKSSRLIETLVNRQVDGFIIVPAEGCEGQIKRLLQEEIPIVLVDRYFPEILTNYIVLDNYHASFDAVKLFVKRGFRNIGMVAYKSSLIHMKERIRGYREAMEANNLKKNIAIGEIRYEQLDRDMRTVLQKFMNGNNKTDALFFATNSLSLSGLYFIMRNGIRVPEDVAIIGFDGNEAFDFFYSPLTYIKQPIHEMAKESVRILLDQINGSKKVAHVTLSHQLIERMSC